MGLDLNTPKHKHKPAGANNAAIHSGCLVVSSYSATRQLKNARAKAETLKNAARLGLKSVIYN